MLINVLGQGCNSRIRSSIIEDVSGPAGVSGVAGGPRWLRGPSGPGGGWMIILDDNREGRVKLALLPCIKSQQSSKKLTEDPDVLAAEDVLYFKYR